MMSQKKEERAFPFLYFRPDDKFFPIVSWVSPHIRKSNWITTVWRSHSSLLFVKILWWSRAKQWGNEPEKYLVVILHHTKDIRKLSYEKEKARNSVQWYGIYDQWVPRELFSVSFIALRTRICESLKMPRMSSHLMWQIDNDLYKAAQLFWADRL